MKTLIIAEKPDMGRNIAAAIEPKAKNQRTYIEGERYVITWAIGHLIGLAEPDLYDERYKKWNFNDLPIIPDTFKLIPNPRTKDQLKVIKELAQRCDSLVNACDAGREGQHIFSLIQRHLKLKQPVKRLWISDLTPETIRKGFAELREGSDFDPLTRAAKARSEADWLIGMNGSRAFTTKHRELLSVGRVQTPVLAILYDRQKEIEAFKSNKYYEVEAWFVQEDTEYRGLWQGERLTDKEKAEGIAARVKGKPGRIDSYDVRDSREYPFKLYDLTLLQREANAKFGFSAKKTLDLAQALYEKHKVISYPRTNSNYVTEQNVPEMHRTLEQLKRTEYAGLAEQADKKLVHTGNRAVCNPTKVEDHHAILPTHKMPGALAPDEKKLYDLVVKRFLSHFYPPALYKIHTVLTVCEKETFKSTVKQELSPGWKTVYAGDPKESKPASRGTKKGGDKEDEEEAAEEEITTPFTLDAAAAVDCRKSAAKEKETKPPKAYTEGTLLKAMESAGKQIEDEELRDVMKDSGLGTPATRASVIERLKQVGYVVMQGKRIEITTKGRTAIELIRGAGVELLTSPEMTGQWERRLNEIARGSASDETFMQNVKRFTISIVDKVRGQRPAEKQAFGTEAEAKQEKPKRRSAAKSEAGAESGSGKAPAKRSKRSPVSAAASTDTAAASRTSAKRTAAGAASAHQEPAGRTRPSGSRGPADGQSAAAAHGGDAAGRRAGAALSERPAAKSGGAGGSDAATAAGYTQLGTCPRDGCEGRIIRGKRGYGCSAYKSGCTFVIWKDSFGASLTDTAVAYLLRHGRTARMKLQDEQGHWLEGSIVLRNRTTGELGIEPVQG
ncbi:DNA topoisomerase 3 [Paenibacillus puerhi]|uniref:DNA topoisomerase 3 n=1 Tax=Paenibacillus puerhi TaxID=2692622 RepID=UPI00135B81F7|nr:DNA topoisomerase 3 [Paenibacillus puerhi]